MRVIRRLENRLTNVSCPNYLIPSIAFVSKKIFKSKKVILDPVSTQFETVLHIEI